MSIEETKGFTTPDGMIFKTREEALAHIRAHEVNELVSFFFDFGPGSQYPKRTRTITTRVIVDFCTMLAEMGVEIPAPPPLVEDIAIES